MAVLRAALDAPPFEDRPVHLVFGVVADKRVEPMLERLLPRCRSASLTPLPTPRSLDPARYLAQARALCPRVDVFPTPADALSAARVRATADDGWMVVAGSLYLVGAVKALLGAPRHQP